MLKNCCKNKSIYYQQHVGSALDLTNATQSLIPFDKYGMIGPYALFRVKTLYANNRSCSFRPELVRHVCLIVPFPLTHSTQF